VVTVPHDRQRRQFFDDEQASDTALRTPGDILAREPEQQRFPALRLPGRLGRGGRRGLAEQLPGRGQGVLAHGVGQESVVPDPDLGQVLLIEQRELDGAAGDQGLNRRGPQRGEPVPPLDRLEIRAEAPR
jgi:hypothetical protein